MIVKEAHIAPKSFRPVVRDIDFGTGNEEVLLSLSEKLEAIALAEGSVAKEAVPLLKRIDKSTSVLPKIYERLDKGKEQAVERKGSGGRVAKRARRSGQQSKQSVLPGSAFAPPPESAGAPAPGLPAKSKARRKTARKKQSLKKSADKFAMPSPPRGKTPGKTPEPERMGGSPPPGPPMQSAAASERGLPGPKSVKPEKNKAGTPAKPKSARAQHERAFFKEQETAIRKGFAFSLKQLGGKAYLGARNTLGIDSNDFMAKNRRRKIADVAGNATLGPLYGIVEEVRDFTDEVRDYRRGTYRNESIKGRVLGKLFDPAKSIDNSISRKLGIHSAKSVKSSGTGGGPARDRFGRYVKKDAYSSRRNAVPQGRRIFNLAGQAARRDEETQGLEAIVKHQRKVEQTDKKEHEEIVRCLRGIRKAVSEVDSGAGDRPDLKRHGREAGSKSRGKRRGASARKAKGRKFGRARGIAGAIGGTLLGVVGDGLGIGDMALEALATRTMDFEDEKDQAREIPDMPDRKNKPGRAGRKGGIARKAKNIGKAGAKALGRFAGRAATFAKGPAGMAVAAGAAGYGAGTLINRGIGAATGRGEGWLGDIVYESTHRDIDRKKIEASASRAESMKAKMTPEVAEASGGEAFDATKFLALRQAGKVAFVDGKWRMKQGSEAAHVQAERATSENARPGIVLPGVSSEMPRVEAQNLGKLSEKYESGGRGAGTVSTGKGDLGGVSYGTYQMASRGGEKSTAAKFVRNSKWADQFEGMQVGSEAFSSKWKDIAKNDPEFAQAQHNYIKKTHYDPLVGKIQKDTGVDLSGRSKALQDVLWSTAVQHGGGTSMVSKALQGQDVSSMSDEQIIKAIYAERGKRNEVGELAYFKSSSADVQKGVANRYKSEEAQALAMLETERNAPQAIAASARTQPAAAIATGPAVLPEKNTLEKPRSPSAEGKPQPVAAGNAGGNAAVSGQAPVPGLERLINALEKSQGEKSFSDMRQIRKDREEPPAIKTRFDDEALEAISADVPWW